jgi:hypothetical protein
MDRARPQGSGLDLIAVLAKAAMEGRLPCGFSVKRLTDLPMLWSEQWRAVGLREPIRPNSADPRRRYIGFPLFRSTRFIVRPGKREFCRQRLAGKFRCRARENGRDSVRRPGRGSLTYRNRDGFCRPGNRVGLPGLDGGRCRDRTCDPSRVKGVPAHCFCLRMRRKAIVAIIVVSRQKKTR